MRRNRAFTGSTNRRVSSSKKLVVVAKYGWGKVGFENKDLAQGMHSNEWDISPGMHLNQGVGPRESPRYETKFLTIYSVRLKVRVLVYCYV